MKLGARRGAKVSTTTRRGPTMDGKSSAAAATHSSIVLWDNPIQEHQHHPPTAQHSTARQSNGSCDSLFTSGGNGGRLFGNNE